MENVAKAKAWEKFQVDTSRRIKCDVSAALSALMPPATHPSAACECIAFTVKECLRLMRLSAQAGVSTRVSTLINSQLRLMARRRKEAAHEFAQFQQLHQSLLPLVADPGASSVSNTITLLQQHPDFPSETLSKCIVNCLVSHDYILRVITTDLRTDADSRWPHRFAMAEILGALVCSSVISSTDVERQIEAVLRFSLRFSSSSEQQLISAAASRQLAPAWLHVSASCVADLLEAFRQKIAICRMKQSQ